MGYLDLLDLQMVHLDLLVLLVLLLPRRQMSARTIMAVVIKYVWTRTMDSVACVDLAIHLLPLMLPIVQLKTSPVWRLSRLGICALAHNQMAPLYL
jgi:hypothetical protein